MLIYLKWYRGLFNTILIKISATFFVALDNIILKCIWEGEGPRIAKIILKQKRRVNLPNFKTYYRPTVSRLYSIGRGIDTLINGKNREPRNRPLQICPTHPWQRCRSNVTFSINGAGVTWRLYVKKNEPQPKCHIQKWTKNGSWQ